MRIENQVDGFWEKENKGIKWEKEERERKEERKKESKGLKWEKEEWETKGRSEETDTERSKEKTEGRRKEKRKFYLCLVKFVFQTSLPSTIYSVMTLLNLYSITGMKERTR